MLKPTERLGVEKTGVVLGNMPELREKNTAFTFNTYSRRPSRRRIGRCRFPSKTILQMQNKLLYLFLFRCKPCHNPYLQVKRLAKGQTRLSSALISNSYAQKFILLFYLNLNWIQFVLLFNASSKK